LSNVNDSDGDGTGDADEGISDSDQDGIPDYLDDSDDTTRLPLAGGQEIQGPYGMTLSLGGIAFASGQITATVSADDIADYGGPDYGPAADSEDSGASQSIGYFDFRVSGLASPGQVLKLVVGLGDGESIPDNASYRKYRPDVGWSTFVEDGENALASAVRDPFGNCPPPGDPAYTPGLTAGDQCVELMVEEGGANDGDGEANGVYWDPSAVAVVQPTGPSWPRLPLIAFIERLAARYQCVNECVAARENVWFPVLARLKCRLECRDIADPSAATLTAQTPLTTDGSLDFVDEEQPAESAHE
jgi:hypothetical protein